MGASIVAVGEWLAGSGAAVGVSSATAEAAATGTALGATNAALAESAVAAGGATAASGAAASGLGAALAKGVGTGLGLAGGSIAASLLMPQPKAPGIRPETPMPDPLAQEEARKRELIDQMARRGRAASILTSPSGDKLGG